MLDSFARMERPEGADIEFVFCENDEESRVSDVVENFRSEVPEPVQLMLEPQKGIPFARNRVLAAALEQGFDFLTFVDDDEVVKPDWLVNLLSAMQARSLDLCGGPVEFTRPDDRLSPMQEAVFIHKTERSLKNITRREADAAANKDSRLNIYTNNWCVRIDAVRTHGLMFDEAMRYTGGSDTRFSRQMRSAGASIGWAPSAWVSEVLPRKRLTLSYYAGRARDQASNDVLIRQHSTIKTWIRATQRLTDALLNFLSVPVRGRKALVNAGFKFGMATGLLRATMGLKSRHYAPSHERLHVESR
ncbi:hypothetical protein SAMN05444002_1672 [Vannielia litorea]|uniref:Glycosyltransferase 2-like domain-containing protein n=1 Tax=Vannielia litorea TaxID=1217970 RepID=A0A1N6FHD0_9RHOB|nr:hypothetical protein SAMN05444002_1672 [Vannielia litorea]